MNFFNLKEQVYKRIFLLQDLLKVFGRRLCLVLVSIFFLTSSFYLILLTVHFGFQNNGITPEINHYFQLILYILFFTRYLPELIFLKKREPVRWLLDGGVFLFSLVVVWMTSKQPDRLTDGSPAPISFVILNLTIILLISTQLYRLFRVISSVKIAPSLLFAISFLFVILLGSGLLMLPNAQAEPLSYFEALFTSVSAVCVTGLTVIDTASSFTNMGKIIILCLIQTGGLGIMTFTGFFSYIFTGSASYKDRLLLKEMMSSDTLDSLFRMLMQVILITFLAELAGAVLIYLSVENIGENKVLFAVFHAISAFCNAGFSTVPDGMSNPVIEGNPVFVLTISGLIILGGIGFPVMFIFFKILRNAVSGFIPRMKSKDMLWHPLSNNINHRIVLVTTGILLFTGTIFYYLLEKNNSLQGLDGARQFLVAFFGSVSARTAGFNVVDLTRWTTPTLLLMIFLMWVGASPGSTGGGIKTTTFSIALRTCFAFIRGRTSLQIGNREIGRETIMRVLVVIMLSLLVTGTGYFGLLLSDRGKDPVQLLFETFSAFGTVGLSVVNTATLSETGKCIIMLLMFLGRLGPLTVLTGLLVSEKRQYFKYPSQDLVIN